MLKKFEVENYRGFGKKISFDLSTEYDYDFNKKLVKDGIVNKAIIYGKNGTGKSNLGCAICDIASHLSSENVSVKYPGDYINLNSGEKYAKFCYTFAFGKDEAIYSYTKKTPCDLKTEELIFNGERVLYYDYSDKTDNFIADEIKGTLNVSLIDEKLPVLKFIYYNSPTNENGVVARIMNFAKGILYYSSVLSRNDFASGGDVEFLTENLMRTGSTKDFEKFLEELGINYSLDMASEKDVSTLKAVFKKGNANFDEIASSGTLALWLFFIWSLGFKKLQFLFIDEFDAFYHYEVSEKILERLNAAENFQCVVTSHNTLHLNNKIMRPDCCYIMSEGEVKNLPSFTDRELREAHNLEKMYRNKSFEK